MKMRTKKRRKFLINNQKHFEEEQDSFLQLETFFHYRNRRIRLHYRNSSLTKKKSITFISKIMN